MRNQVTSLPPLLHCLSPPSLPCSSIVLPFPPDIVLEFGMTKALSSWSCQYIPEGKRVQQEVYECILSGSPLSSGETKVDLSVNCDLRTKAVLGK